MQKRISVIVPTYNDGHLVERCLASVMTQTVQPLEIIVVDDGSTAPEALSGIERAMEQFPQVRFIRQSNAGASAARNRGLSECRGEFVAFLDADDEIAPNSLAVKRALFERAPGIVAAFAGIVFVEHTGRQHLSHYREYLGVLDPDLVGDRNGVPGFLWAYLFRAEALRAIGGLDESLSIMEDFDALIRLGRTGGIVAGCNEPVHRQNRRLGSVCRGSMLRQPRGALRFLAKARKSAYFSRSELFLRYLQIPRSLLKLLLLYHPRRSPGVAKQMESSS